MSQTPQYARVLGELQVELPTLEKKVLAILTKNPNTSKTRSQLVRRVYGVSPRKDINNDQRDRKIRTAIQNLRANLVPILSNSGEAGYRLDTSPDAIDAMIAEWESRIAKLRKQVKRAKQFYNRKDKQLPLALKGNSK